MPPNPSLAAEPDARMMLDAALESEKGIRIFFPTPGRAQNFRHRCYRLINKERNASRQRWSPEDPHYGRTPYDTLSIYREDDEGTKYTKSYSKADPDDRGNFIVIARLDKVTFDWEELK